MVQKSARIRNFNLNKNVGAKKSMKKGKMGKKSRVQSRKSKGKKMTKKLKGGNSVVPPTVDRSTKPERFTISAIPPTVDRSTKPERFIISTIFFDVDGTLSSTGGCSSKSEHSADNAADKETFIKLLENLKNGGIKLHILTRCSLDKNIKNSINKEYYDKSFLSLFDEKFGSGKDGIGFPINFSNILKLNKNSGDLWAHIKTYFMTFYCLKMNENPNNVYLIDDDVRNATISAKYGFNAITSPEGKEKNGGLEMTIGGLQKISNVNPMYKHINPGFIYGNNDTNETRIENLQEKLQKNIKILKDEIKNFFNEPEDQRVNNYFAELEKTIEELSKKYTHYVTVEPSIPATRRSSLSTVVRPFSSMNV